MKGHSPPHPKAVCSIKREFYLTGLRHLGGMTALQKLHVRGTAVTESGILEALMPLALNHSLAKIIVPRSVSEEVADYMPCTQILL